VNRTVANLLGRYLCVEMFSANRLLVWPIASGRREHESDRVTDTDTDSAERRATRFADEAAAQMARLNDFFTILDTAPSGIRFVAATALNAEAGNQRKRQANLPTKSTRDVYDSLWRHDEQIYSRHGNSTFHNAPASPATTGVMDQAVFARLAPNDHVVVVQPATSTGRALLDGQLELPEINAPQFGPDVWPITAVRVANACDVLAVRQWYLDRLVSTSRDSSTPKANA
jgi:hypothetical protein